MAERLKWDGKNKSSVAEDHEQQLWKGLAARSWENSITDGFFATLYIDTCWYVRRLLEEYDLNTVIEVGCGTGQIIETSAKLVKNDKIEWMGLDINPEFIKHCKKHGSNNVAYHVADATKLLAWTTIMLKNKIRNSLVLCVNNTLSIMPEEIRPQCIRQMRIVAGPQGLVFLSYWNGSKFREGLVQYYQRNPDLCGNFKVGFQDFQRRKLLTETGYTSHWPLEHEVETMLRCYGVPIVDILEVKVVGKGIFAILRGCTNKSNL